VLGETTEIKTEKWRIRFEWAERWFASFASSAIARNQDAERLAKTARQRAWLPAGQCRSVKELANNFSVLLRSIRFAPPADNELSP